MSDASTDHPRDDLLTAFGRGQLDEFLAASVSRHLERCTPCRDRAASLSGGTPAPQLTPGGRPERTAPYQPPGAPPELLAHPQYELVRELDRGGMGVVYLVRNTLMDRLEALKVLNKALLEKPGSAERFLREIRAAAKLQHPNIVTAYNALRLGDGLGLVMEYVVGDDLAQVVRDHGPMAVGLACACVAQAARGLQHAHEQGMIHRDIKPSNLIRAKQGGQRLVKILDFGLAKATAVGGDVSLTGTDDLLGTPDFIAPEQIQYASKVDIRADVYSLGCTLYFLLAGRPPFPEGTSYQRLTAHLTHAPEPVAKLRPDVPPGVVAVLGRMMAKRPDDRFAEPGEVARALEPFEDEAAARPEPPPPVRPSGPRFPTHIEDGILDVVPADAPPPTPASGSAQRTPTRVEAPRPPGRTAERTPTLVESPPAPVGPPPRARLRRVLLWVCAGCFVLGEIGLILDRVSASGYFASTRTERLFRSNVWKVTEVHRTEQYSLSGVAYIPGESVWTVGPERIQAGKLNDAGQYGDSWSNTWEICDWSIENGVLSVRNQGADHRFRFNEISDSAMTLGREKYGAPTGEYVRFVRVPDRWYAPFRHLAGHWSWLPGVAGVVGGWYFGGLFRRRRWLAFLATLFATPLLATLIGAGVVRLNLEFETNRGMFWDLIVYVAAAWYLVLGGTVGLVAAIIRVRRMRQVAPAPANRRRSK